MVSSIQLRFHLTKKSQGGIGLVWSWEAVSQGRGYWPACLGQLSGHNPTGEGDSLGMSGQSHCSCHGSAVSCKGCSEPLGPGLPGRFLLVLAGLQLSEVSFSCLGSALGPSMPQAPLLGAPAHPYLPAVPGLPIFLPVLHCKHNSTQNRKRTC